MTTSVTTDKTKQRLRLQRRRQVQLLQAIWRFMVGGTIVGGLFWSIALPNWIIRQRSQVEIEGNRLIDRETIYALLPLSYPQSLWQLPTQRLIQELESQPPIERVKITRRILPPSLTIQIEERQPVAIALPTQGTHPQGLSFLDREGVSIPRHFYAKVGKNFPFPALKVKGWREQNRPYWPELYQLIKQSPVKIFAVECQDLNNLILKTELGSVHLGTYTSQLAEQFKTLAEIKKLPERTKIEEIDYIDLSDPRSPSIQLLPKKSESSV